MFMYWLDGDHRLGRAADRTVGRAADRVFDQTEKWWRDLRDGLRNPPQRRRRGHLI